MKIDKYCDELSQKIANASLDELEEIADEIEYELLIKMSVRIQNKILAAQCGRETANEYADHCRQVAVAR